MGTGSFRPGYSSEVRTNRESLESTWLDVYELRKYHEDIILEILSSWRLSSQGDIYQTRKEENLARQEVLTTSGCVAET